MYLISRQATVVRLLTVTCKQRFTSWKTHSGRIRAPASLKEYMTNIRMKPSC